AQGGGEVPDLGVERLDALHGGELGHLAEERAVLHRVQRVLVLELLGHEAQEVGLPEGVPAATGAVRAGRGQPEAGIDVACDRAHSGVPQRPMVRVATASSLAVLMTSTPAW